MERFLLELGVGFTFVARQKRISLGADDFYLDLLFYHRHLRRLVAVERKLRIPVKLDSDSGGKWTLVPVQSGQRSERSDAGVGL